MPRITRALRDDPVGLDEDRHPARARAAYASVVLEKIRQVREGYGQPGTRNNQMMGILPGVLDAWPTVRSGELVSGDDKAVWVGGQDRGDRRSGLVPAHRRARKSATRSPNGQNRVSERWRIPAGSTAARSTPILKKTIYRWRR